jgi:hypothetical protein
MIVNLSRMLRGGVAAGGLGVALVIAGCNSGGTSERRLVSRYYGATDSMGATPTHLSITRGTVPIDLVENSAAAMSMTQPGIFFSINDSGNDPLLFALDTTGRGRGVWRIATTSNVDWEAAAIGPCAAAASAWCVYIGDVGDNEARHRSRKIYRVAEPRAMEPGASRRGSLEAERLTFEYPNGPQDVEAMYVARNGDVFLIAKRPRLDAARQPLPALVYRLSAGAWTEKGRVVAELVDSLPIVPGSAPFRVITDAALSPDAKHLAVRTYMQLYIFDTDSMTGRVDHGISPTVCNLLTVDEIQGEGVTWADNNGRFVFTTEGRQAPIALADCPLPP